MRIAISVALLSTTSAVAEAPLQPVKDVSTLPIELRLLQMIAVAHQWSPLDRPWKTVSHVTFPVGDLKLVEDDDRVFVFDPKSNSVSPAQISVVAWNGNGSPEVVQAIFEDEVAKGLNVRCLFLKGGSPTPRAAEDPWTLATPNDAIAVRMKDGLGATYSARLFERRVGQIKNGPIEYAESYFTALQPDKPESAAMRQPFRIHSFVTGRKGEPWLDVRLLVENCSSENPAGDFPFVSLEIGVKNRELKLEESILGGRQSDVIEDDRLWTALILPNDDGKLHHAQDHFLLRLRFAMSTPNLITRASVRMQHEPLYVAVPGLDPTGKPTNSWNSSLAFGPTRVGIPRGDGPHAAIRDRVDREAETWLQQQPLLKKLGPFWVHGEVGGEAPSGVEIAFTCPWAAKFVQSGGAPSPWRLINAVFDANLARQRFGFWKQDGSLWTLDDVLETKEGVQVTPDLNIHSGRPHATPYCRKFGRNERFADASYKALNAIANDPAKMAPYIKELEGYSNYDDEHLCRFTQYLFPLVWLANDPVAKTLLEAQASVSMASSNPFPIAPDGDAAFGSLAELHRVAAKEPGRGSPHLARGAGWNAQAVVGGLATTRNPHLRKLGQKWLSDFARLPGICQLPTGGVHRTDQDQKASFDLNGDGRVSKEELEMPVEHGSIYMQGIYRLAGCRSVFMQLDGNRHAAERQSLEKAMKTLDAYFISFAWDDTVNLPGWNNAVVVKARPKEIVVKKRPGTVWGGGPDAAYYFDDILAEAYRLSGNDEFLTKIAAMHGGELQVERDSGNTIHAAWVIEALKKKR
jgi:hypothetical protein